MGEEPVRESKYLLTDQLITSILFQESLIFETLVAVALLKDETPETLSKAISGKPIESPYKIPTNLHNLLERTFNQARENYLEERVPPSQRETNPLIPESIEIWKSGMIAFFIIEGIKKTLSAFAEKPETLKEMWVEAVEKSEAFKETLRELENFR